MLPSLLALGLAAAPVPLPPNGLSGDADTKADTGHHVRHTVPRSSVTLHLIRRCPPMADCLSAEIVRRMKEETERIWSSLDVRIAWIGSVDAEHPAGAAVRLRVMLEEGADPGLAWTVHRGLLLAALHQPDIPCGTGLARVWVTRARRHAASIRVHGFPLASLPKALADLVLARALGRALAHEIGHYLLGTGMHNSQGLMRASFTPQELLELATEALYGLDRRDREALRRRTNCTYH